MSGMQDISRFDNWEDHVPFLEKIWYEGKNNNFSFRPVDFEECPVRHPDGKNQ